MQIRSISRSNMLCNKVQPLGSPSGRAVTEGDWYYFLIKIFDFNQKGIRPSVPCHHIREYRYAYGAVEPLTGESCFLVMPLLQYCVYESVPAGIIQTISPGYHSDTISWLKSLISIRKASPNGAACFVIYKERNHKTSLIGTPCPSGN